MSYRFILEPYSGLKSRYRCPSCGKANQLSRYVDTENDEYVHRSVGRCNRIIKCGYHFTPKHYFKNIPKERTKLVRYKKLKKRLPPEAVSYIDVSILKKTINYKYSNCFIEYLLSIFDSNTVEKLRSKYHIGTSKKWKGATIFWQVDHYNKIRTGKIIQYDPFTGKRVKKPYNLISWAHKALNKNDFSLKQCFYGEHIIKLNTNPIAIVESEKTAIIASVFLPEFTWIATGGLSNLNLEKTKILKGRQVILFPDLNAFNLWEERIPNLCNEATYQISDLLERKATKEERNKGLDIADYLLRIDVNKSGL